MAADHAKKTGRGRKAPISENGHEKLVALGGSLMVCLWWGVALEMQTIGSRKVGVRGQEGVDAGGTPGWGVGCGGGGMGGGTVGSFFTQNEGMLSWCVSSARLSTGSPIRVRRGSLE